MIIQRLILNLLFSLLAWTIIRIFIIEIKILEYFLVELVVIICLKLYIYTSRLYFTSTNNENDDDTY